MEFLNVIKNRQSCRAFADEQVTEEQLRQIIEAANAAPVGMGEYDKVHLSVIQNNDLIAKLEANAHNAIPAIPEHPMYGLTTAIAINCKNEDNPSMAFANASCIAENMMLAATDLGLGSIYIMAVPAAAQYNTELCHELKVPDGFAPHVIVGVGNLRTRRKSVISQPSVSKLNISDEYKNTFGLNKVIGSRIFILTALKSYLTLSSTRSVIIFRRYSVSKQAISSSSGR